MKVYVDNLELLGHRAIFIKPTQKAKIILDESQPNLTISLNFASDEENKERRLSYKKESDTALGVTYINFGKAPGTFHPDTIKFGSFKNKVLHFNYFVKYLSDRAGYMVEVFFYLGEEVGNE